MYSTCLLNKKDRGVRPLVVGEYPRAIVAKAAGKQVRSLADGSAAAANGVRMERPNHVAVLAIKFWVHWALVLERHNLCVEQYFFQCIEPY